MYERACAARPTLATRGIRSFWNFSSFARFIPAIFLSNSLFQWSINILSPPSTPIPKVIMEIVDANERILSQKYPKRFESWRQETKLYKTLNSEVLPICVSARTMTSATCQKSSVGVFPGSTVRSRTSQGDDAFICLSSADVFFHLLTLRLSWGREEHARPVCRSQRVSALSAWWCPGRDGWNINGYCHSAREVF